MDPAIAKVVAEWMTVAVLLLVWDRTSKAQAEERKNWREWFDGQNKSLMTFMETRDTAMANVMERTTAALERNTEAFLESASVIQRCQGFQPRPYPSPTDDEMLGNGSNHHQGHQKGKT